MKRLLTYIFFSMAVSSTLVAADTVSIRQLFIDMPDEVIPYLSKNNRLDFIDFMDSKMKAEVTNNLGGKSEMTALTDSAICLKMNDVSNVSIYLCKTTVPIDSSSHVICLIRNYQLQSNYAETTTAYYSTRWRPLPGLPSLTELDRKRVAAATEKQNIINVYRDLLNKH